LKQYVFISLTIIFCILLPQPVMISSSPQADNGAIIADHTIVRMVMDDMIPEEAIEDAKDNLHIAYEHTSHGSQITTGMDGLPDFKVSKGGTVGLYNWTDGPQDGCLDLDNDAMASYADSASDLGYSDWAEATGNYLNDSAHSDVNVVMWSWCGQVGSYDEQGLIDHYLQPMTQLEESYPGVMFVYMTGHVDGNGLEGSVHRSNEQIRNYTKNNGKILFDFADIESYDPDGNYFGDKYVTDGCNYHNDTYSGNWATEWQDAHPGEWYDCVSAHSQPLNANMKAYAAWWLWARLAGWGNDSSTTTTTSGVTELITGPTYSLSVISVVFSVIITLSIKKKN